MLIERKEINVVYEWKWKCLTFNVLMEPNNNNYITFHPVYSAGTAVIRGDTPFHTNYHYYWEFQLCNNIYGTDIMIGVGTRNVSLSAQKYTFCSLLGMNEESYGYSYHGFVQHDNKRYKYGRKFTQGATVGVYLDMFAGTIEFYVNRVPLGVAFKRLKGKELYPMVSSTTANSMIKLTDAHVHDETLQLKCMRAIARDDKLMRELYNVPGLKDMLSNRYMWLKTSNDDYNNNNVDKNKSNKIYADGDIDDEDKVETRRQRIKNLNDYCTAG